MNAFQSPPPMLYLTHARVVLADTTLDDAAVLVADGAHRSHLPERGAAGAREIDLTGRILMPGMIDLHCDALEKEVEPRPGVHFPLDFACAQADKRNAAAGITTVFHALSFANHELGVRNNGFAAEIARAVGAWQAACAGGQPRACTLRGHRRDGTSVPDRAAAPGPCAPASASWTTRPGQGQFKDVTAFRELPGQELQDQRGRVRRHRRAQAGRRAGAQPTHRAGGAGRA